MKAPIFAQNTFINQLRFFSTSPTEAQPELQPPIPTFLPGEEAIIRIPPNINAWKLGKLLDEEPMELLKILDEQTNEVITDEFQILGREAIELVCLELEEEIEFVEVEEEEQKLYRKRAPVVTIMGHVDHGKTTLLDSFRSSKSSLAAQEFGLITQTIGAFTISTDNGNEITFIDTPGHEAFQNLRSRGAKVTDMIILVISAVESVQRQTIEVINLVNQMKIPLIVAINKIDREEADVDAVLLDLESQNIIAEDLGGNVCCVPISAKEGVNIKLLEQSIVKLADKKINLMEDHAMCAQCITIESNIDDKSGQLTATVLVKKGVLKSNDTFVCGQHEGKVRFMRDDNGRNIHEAFPGQAVHLGGFKQFPEVGNPLYVVENHKEANMIVQTLQQRAHQEEMMKLLEKGDNSEDIKNKIGKLTRLEKRRIKAGDKTILFQRLGIAEESDIDKLKKRFGVKTGLDELNIEEVLEGASNIGRRKNKRKLRIENEAKDDLKKLIIERNEAKENLKQMDEDEILEQQKQKAKIQEMFRDDNIGYQPIMIKASQAGPLETLLSEAENIIGDQFKLQIVSTGVGPLSEKDLSEANQTGAIIFGFDISVAPNVANRIESAGVSVHLHKLIYKFQDDLENLVHDMNQKEELARGGGLNIEILGEAHILQIFDVTEKGNKKQAKKQIQIAGSRVYEGEINDHMKYRIIRDGELIQDNLSINSLKKFQKPVKRVEKGIECGIALNGVRNNVSLQSGDVLECYKEKPVEANRFPIVPGLRTSY